MAQNEFDVVVIGSGPGGYVGAIRAAELGLKTAIIEKDKTYGGTCLNVGCIPSKALLDSSEHFSMAQHDFANHGVKLSKIELDLAQMMKRKEKVVAELTGGLAFLFKKNKIEAFQGRGRLVSSNEVEVTHEGGKSSRLSARHIILATGSVVNQLASCPYDGKMIVSSTEALCFNTVPKHLVVIGGGYIGLELGSVWRRLGSEVTVIEFFDHICGNMDRQLSGLLKRSLEKQGIKFMVSTKVTEAKVSGAKVLVKCESVDDGSSTQLEAAKVLVAAGRKPYTEGLGLEALGIELDKMGRVVIDEHYHTSLPHIFAIGDLIHGPMLAHKAEEEGVAVAEIIAGQAGHVNYLTVPGVIYTWPEVASVGYTEEQVKEKGIPYKVGTFPFTPNGRAKAMASTEGLAKVIAHAETDRILGVHIMGPRASDMIAEAVVAMEFAGSSEDLARSFHAHPTLSEVLREAALNVHKRARQM